MIGTIVFVVAAFASDPILAASTERILGTAWSDAIGFLMRVVSSAG
jgi:hypothetical protein